MYVHLIHTMQNLLDTKKIQYDKKLRPQEKKKQRNIKDFLKGNGIFKEIMLKTKNLIYNLVLLPIFLQNTFTTNCISITYFM